MKKQFIARSGTEGSVLRVLALGFLLLGVTACGGGGSSGNQNLSSASSINNVNNDGSVSSAASSANSSLPNTSDNGTQNPTTPPSNPPVDQPPINQPPVDPPMDQEPADQNPDTEPGSEDPESPPVDNPADETDEEAPSVWRPFNDDSPWNQPIPTDVSLHPESEELIAHMRQGVNLDYLWLNIQEWSIPVYEVDSSVTPVVEVSVTSINGASTTNSWTTPFPVPIPADALPDRQSDAHMVVLDRGLNKSWDFWRAAKSASGEWQCGVCNTSDLSGTGVRPLKGQGTGEPWFRSHGSRACGFPLLAGLIRPEEIAAGRIDHALYVGYPRIRSNVFTHPASTAQAPKNGINHCEGIPCGGRIQLDPNLNLDELGLTREARIIAEALQTYGAYVGDYAGASVVLNVQNNPDALSSLGGLLTNHLLSAISLEHFRVVQWGTEFVDQEITAACPVTADEQAPEIEEPELENYGFETVTCPAAMFDGSDDARNSAATSANNSATTTCARIRVQNINRYFIYEVPTSYDPERAEPYPVVFAWHGCHGSGGGMRNATRSNLGQPVIAIYPHSRLEDSNGQLITDSSPPQSCWLTVGEISNNSHLAFFDALLEVVKANFNVDEEQIISLGYSSGAAMSHYLGCERADLLKGVVAVAGWPAGSCALSGASGPAVPIVFAHGEHDAAVPFSYFDSAVTGYVSRNSCDSQEVLTTPETAGPYQSCYEHSCSGASLAYCVSECDGVPAENLAACQEASGHRLGVWDSWFYRYGLSRFLSN